MLRIPNIIRNTEADAGKRKVMDGVLRSTFLSPTQRQDVMEGIVRRTMPEKKAPAHAAVVKVKEGKTRRMPGAVHIPGSPYY
jgi:hypothetical protein